MYKRRPSAALAMTASFSAALIGSPPVTLLAPVGATGAMWVLAKESATVSTADMLMVDCCLDLSFALLVVDCLRKALLDAFLEIS